MPINKLGYFNSKLMSTLAGTGGGGGGGDVTPPAVFQEYLFLFTGRMSPIFILLTGHPFYVPPENFKTLTRQHLTYDAITGVMSGGKCVP